MNGWGRRFYFDSVKMKFTASLVGGAVLLGAVSCKEKPKSVEAPAGEKSVVEKVAETVEKVVAPKVEESLSDDERAAKLGFAKYLPKDTEMVMSVYNARKAADQLKALKLYGIFEDEMGMDLGEGAIEEDILEDAPIEEGEQDADADADADAAEAGMVEGPSPWLLLGQEITLALGDTTGEQTARLMRVSRRMSYFQARAMGKAAQSYAKTGKMDDFSETMQNSMGKDLMKELMEDSESGIPLFEKAEMPPIYFAMKVKPDEMEQALQMINGGMAIFGMAGEMAAPVEFETGGGKFAGFKLMGEEIAKTMKEEKESIAEDLGEKNADALIEAISKKNLIVVTGSVGDYVVFMIGGSQESMKLVSETKESIVATDGLNFADAYADKQFVSVIYGDKGLWDDIMVEASGLATYALGLRDGIAGGGGLGDVRDLEAMLQIVADREKDLLSMGRADTLGMVAFVDEGLRIESIGGYDKGAIDWDAKTTLAHLGDSGDNMLFLNMPTNADYDEKMGDYFEAIVETVYAATVKMSELDVEAPELAEMKEFMQLFEGKFRADTVGICDALGGMSKGLGHESAIVIDLKGSMPAIPGLPQKFVDEAKAPRITMVSPVTDRTKLSAAWKDMNLHTTSLLEKVSEMAGEKIPMQKPVSSEKDGMTTWFFSFPFFQDDFMPSVTVSDKWFAASTSKTQAQDLISKAAAGGAAGNGVKFYVNFNAMTNYADEMLAIVDKNSAEMFTDEFDLEDFNSQKADFKKVIDACRDFDSLNWTIRKEGGLMRSSVHFKTK